MHTPDLLSEGHHPEQRFAVPEVQAAARLGRPPASKLRSTPRNTKGDACAEKRQQVRKGGGLVARQIKCFTTFRSS